MVFDRVKIVVVEGQEEAAGEEKEAAGEAEEVCGEVGGKEEEAGGEEEEVAGEGILEQLKKETDVFHCCCFDNLCDI